MRHGFTLTFQFAKFSGSILQRRFHIREREGDLLHPFISLKDIIVQTSFTPAKGFILAVSFKQTSLQFFDLFDKVVVLS